MGTRTKTFDCVEMKRRGAEKVQAATCHMSHAEELDFWARGTAELQEEQQSARRSGTQRQSFVTPADRA
jgi:hypothetical protein